MKLPSCIFRNVCESIANYHGFDLTHHSLGPGVNLEIAHPHELHDMCVYVYTYIYIYTYIHLYIGICIRICCVQNVFSMYMPDVFHYVSIPFFTPHKMSVGSIVGSHLTSSWLHPHLASQLRCVGVTLVPPYFK